jgi:hypothetical protein
MIIAEYYREAALDQCLGFFANPLIRIHPVPVGASGAAIRLAREER